MASGYAFRGSTMRYGRVGSIYVVVHGALPPSNVDWEGWLDHVNREVPMFTGMLVYTEGGGPDAGQRRKTAEMWARQARMPAIAVVTRSSVVRLMVTALNYFLSRPIRGYAPGEIGEALSEHLKVAPGDREEILVAVAVALRSLQQVETATV
jgi:hypothetical protein